MGFFSFLFFFAIFHLSIEWTVWGSFASFVFLNLSHFDALSIHPSCLNVLAHFYAWWIFFLFWWTLFWMNLVFLLEWWILGSSNLMHILLSLTLMEFHFSFLHCVKPHFSLMISYLYLNEFSTCLSCLLGELYQLASKLQGRLLLNMRFKHAYFEFFPP